MFAWLRQLQLVLLLISIREDMEQTSRWAASERAWAVLLRSTRQATIGVRCGALQQQRMRERVRAAILRTGVEHRRKTRWVVGLASPLQLTGRVLLSGEYNVVARPWLAAPARVLASMNARRAAGHKHDLDQQTDGLAGGRAIPRQSGGILGSLPVARVHNYRYCFCDSYAKIRIESVPRFYVTYICMHGGPHIGANWVG